MRDAQDLDVLSHTDSARRRLAWSVPMALGIVVIDQATKRWALDNLLPGSCAQPDACIDLVAGARLHLVFNTGAAFTRGAGFGPLIGVLAAVMSAVLLFLSTRRPDRLGILAFGAVAGGAIGNLLDRLFRADDGFLSGAVVDFIDLGWWPVFNIADSAIVVGVVVIIAHAFLFGDPQAVDAPDPEDRSGQGHTTDGADEGAPMTKPGEPAGPSDDGGPPDAASSGEDGPIGQAEVDAAALGERAE